MHGHPVCGGVKRREERGHFQIRLLPQGCFLQVRPGAKPLRPVTYWDYHFQEPEGVIDEVERRAPDGFAHIDDVLSRAEREAIVKGYAQLAGFAKEQVNREPSLAPLSKKRRRRRRVAG